MQQIHYGSNNILLNTITIYMLPYFLENDDESQSFLFYENARQFVSWYTIIHRLKYHEENMHLFTLKTCFVLKKHTSAFTQAAINKFALNFSQKLVNPTQIWYHLFFDFQVIPDRTSHLKMSLRFNTTRFNTILHQLDPWQSVEYLCYQDATDGQRIEPFEACRQKQASVGSHVWC